MSTRSNEVAGRGDQRQGVERLAHECLRASLERPVMLLERRHGEHRNTFSKLLAQSQPRAARDHEVDNCQVYVLATEKLQRITDCSHDMHFVAFGAQEILGQLRGIRITLDEKNRSLSGLF